jgi:hypothetical protein
LRRRWLSVSPYTITRKLIRPATGRTTHDARVIQRRDVPGFAFSEDGIQR